MAQGCRSGGSIRNVDPETTGAGRCCAAASLTPTQCHSAVSHGRGHVAVAGTYCRQHGRLAHMLQYYSVTVQRCTSCHRRRGRQCRPIAGHFINWHTWHVTHVPGAGSRHTRHRSRCSQGMVPVCRRGFLTRCCGVAKVQQGAQPLTYTTSEPLPCVYEPTRRAWQLTTVAANTSRGRGITVPNFFLCRDWKYTKLSCKCG